MCVSACVCVCVCLCAHKIEERERERDVIAISVLSYPLLTSVLKVDLKNFMERGSFFIF